MLSNAILNKNIFLYFTNPFVILWVFFGCLKLKKWKPRCFFFVLLSCLFEIVDVIWVVTCQQCTWDGSLLTYWGSATVRDYVMFDNYFAFTLFFFGLLEWDWIWHIIYIYFVTLFAPLFRLSVDEKFLFYFLLVKFFISDCSA